MEERVGPLIFTSNFDSGNLARVERVKADENSSAADDVDNSSVVLPVPDYEYNVWTAPDCAGTEHENPNRTWFHFGVKGGQAGKLLRINIMNLNRQGKLYSQGMAPMVRVLHGKNKWERVRDRPTFEMSDGQFHLSFNYRFPDQRNGCYHFAFCYPHSYTECQTKLQQLDKQFASCEDLSPSSPPDSIYYKRELLCYSLDGLRIDLVTVTSCKGMLAEREQRLPRLFPDVSSPRPHRFQGKKVFFVSARVHPGETPSSLVFNGFLDFILRSADPRAAAARDHFVFKLIPLLNPDGVKRGHYRTDSRGVNLNRVYIDPDPFLHPSIFAAKSVIMYHHAKGSPVAGKNSTCKECRGHGEDVTGVTGGKFTKEATDEPGESRRLPSGDAVNECSEETVAYVDNSYHPSASPTFDSARLELESVMSGIAEDHEESKLERDVCSDLQTLQSNGEINTNPVNDSTLKMESNAHGHRSGLKEKQVTNTKIAADNSQSYQSKTESRDHFSGAKLSAQKCLCQSSTDKESGMAFYIDLHGHASKRGCFVYANYLENEEEYVQTILFPKLVSLNSSHFDFAACNFTEKNMYTKDKRDGMSKEGSGRVAIHKATGIIHSYTLECNYNCGRTVNTLAAATCDNGRATPPPPPGFPPKYTVEMYEEVGRALALASLDMKNCNPWTRLPLSEFGAVEGVRNWVRRFVKSAKSVPSVPKKLSRIITRTSSLVAGATCARQKVGNALTSYSSSDMSSENAAAPVSNESANKARYAIPWGKGERSLSDSGCQPAANHFSSFRAKRPPEDLKPPRRVAALINMKRSPHCAQGNGPRIGRAAKAGPDQQPQSPSSPSKSQPSKNKDQCRVSLELPRTTLQGPVLRMVKHQSLPPAVKDLSRPVEVKVSTVNVQDHLLGFQPKKKGSSVGEGRESDDEKRKKRGPRLRKRSNHKKVSTEGAADHCQRPAELPEWDASPLGQDKPSSATIPTKHNYKQAFMAKRSNSKPLLDCAVVSCEAVDIAAIPRAPQDGTSPVAYWVDA